jgi:DNA mismatch repair protein MutL
LYGERPDLVEVSKAAAGISVGGYIAALVDQGPARGPQNIYVNRRVVKDRTIAHAIHEAYSRATVKLRSPEVHLFIELPPDRVDVNVHPMKAEVRFLEQSLVHEVLRRALGDALGQPSSAPLPRPGRAAQPAIVEPRSYSIPGIVQGMSAVSRWSPITDMFAREGPIARGAEPAPSVPGLGSPAGSPLIPLGQFRDTFIVAVDNDGIVIIDQHVAHERILYEQVMTRLTDGPLAGQRLLTPIVVELSAGQREALATHQSHLDRLGFEVEAFGGESIRIVTVPELLRRTESETAVRELASDLAGLDRGTAVEDVLKRVAALTACHAAVKANDRLTQEKMSYILDQLQETSYSTVCPHGRPVVLRLTRQEIEKSFDRI